jgi:hypothetical protein
MAALGEVVAVVPEVGAVCRLAMARQIQAAAVEHGRLLESAVPAVPAL